MLARKFLYVIAGLVFLTLGSAFVYRMWGQQMIAAVMVPNAPFHEPAPLTVADYARADMWIARPDGRKDDPSRWLPAGAWKPAEPGKAAIFFVHPTSYMAPSNHAGWNDSLKDRESRQMAEGFVRQQASALSAAGTVWAPRYRQAHFGAFFDKSGTRDKAIEVAYRDIEAAFAAFLAANPDGPILLAGHSQGSLLLMRLMRDHVAGKPVAGRVAAAYLVGWPVSLTADLPVLGLPACANAQDAGCVLSWQSFAEPADPKAVTEAYASYRGLNGASRAGTPMLCINPLTGAPGGAAPANLNLGTLNTAVAIPQMPLVKGAVPARCGTSAKEAGFLLIGDPPLMGPFALPGNNYHVYDYALFWANIRLDASRRLTSFLTR